MSQPVPLFLSAVEALHHGVGQQVSLVCRVVNLSSPRYLDGVAKYTLELSDLAGALRVRTLPIGDPALIGPAIDALREGVRVIATGCFTPQARPGRARAQAQAEEGPELHLMLTGLSRQVHPSALLSPRPDEVAEADARIDAL